jgi:hypothetical protein
VPCRAGKEDGQHDKPGKARDEPDQLVAAWSARLPFDPGCWCSLGIEERHAAHATCAAALRHELEPLDAEILRQCREKVCSQRSRHDQHHRRGAGKVTATLGRVGRDPPGCSEHRLAGRSDQGGDRLVIFADGERRTSQCMDVKVKRSACRRADELAADPAVDEGAIGMDRQDGGDVEWQVDGRPQVVVEPRGIERPHQPIEGVVPACIVHDDFSQGTLSCLQALNDDATFEIALERVVLAGGAIEC